MEIRISLFSKSKAEIQMLRKDFLVKRGTVPQQVVGSNLSYRLTFDKQIKLKWDALTCEGVCVKGITVYAFQFFFYNMKYFLGSNIIKDAQRHTFISCNHYILELVWPRTLPFIVLKSDCAVEPPKLPGPPDDRIYILHKVSKIVFI